METNSAALSGWNADFYAGGLTGDALVAWAPAGIRGADTQAILFVPEDWNQGVDEFLFEENSDGGVSLIKYCGSEANVIIPSTYDGKPVTAIGTLSTQEGAFSNCPTVVSVTIPEGVTTLYDNTFYGCLRLEEVSFPVSVRLIGHCNFNLCPALKSLSFQGDAPKYGNYLFDPDGIGQIELHYPADSSGWDADLWGYMIQIPE